MRGESRPTRTSFVPSMTFGNLKLRSHDGEFRSKEPGIRTAAKRNFVHPHFQVQKHCDPKDSPHTRASLKLHFTWPPFPVGCARSPCRITITLTSIMNRGSRRKLKKCYDVINVHLRMVRLTVQATTRRTAAGKKKRCWHGPRLERNSSRWPSNMWPNGCGK